MIASHLGSGSVQDTAGWLLAEGTIPLRKYGDETPFVRTHISDLSKRCVVECELRRGTCRAHIATITRLAISHREGGRIIDINKLKGPQYL